MVWFVVIRDEGKRTVAICSELLQWLPIGIVHVTFIVLVVLFDMIVQVHEGLNNLLTLTLTEVQCRSSTVFPTA